MAKLLPPHNPSAGEVAEQEGISLPTVYKWRKEAAGVGPLPAGCGFSGGEGGSSKDRFGAVVETAALNTEEIVEYCRRRGLYPEQLARWRQNCEQAGNMSQQERRREAEEMKAQRYRIRELARVQRKEAALAETAALLMLSKKAQAIWGVEA